MEKFKHVIQTKGTLSFLRKKEIISIHAQRHSLFDVQRNVLIKEYYFLGYEEGFQYELFELQMFFGELIDYEWNGYSEKFNCRSLRLLFGRKR